MNEFGHLKDARREVAEFVLPHRRSLEEFRADEQAWFKLFPDEKIEDKNIRHKTTTASCLESLDDTSLEDTTAGKLVEDIAPRFARYALDQPEEEWESEQAAWVYCRVRTLPAIVRFAPSVADEKHDKIRELVDYVWAKVAPAPRRQGVYERPKLHEDEVEEKQHPSYPPNAFHTYWALRILHLCSQRSALKGIAATHEQRRNIAVLWTQNVLASQVALQGVDSDRADPNQLAWSLIAQFVNPADPAEPAVSEFARRDLYKAALDAFFKQQLGNGNWPIGQPLFHYPEAGNAYCYTFETLTELLRPALYEREGVLLRNLLLPHLEGLMRAFWYAKISSRVIGDDGVALGWSSGHHPHRTGTEGWATAAVFSFAQCLRRLLATWTRNAALAQLDARPARPVSRAQAVSRLAERGDTWRSEAEWSVGEQLGALFLHPINARVADREYPIDPDLPLIAKDQARSAILFGPPGTGKTKLVETLAAAIGWRFVSVHASDFLSRGMDHVPARADEIFDWLMELDHCVVLFDEVDELLRERQEAETDPFGRFLTTTMLPKVAELWNQRRVVFFVATNDIAHADRAIKRSQRFDAAIFVPPPSLAAKLKRLREIQGSSRETPRVNLADVEEALKKDADQNPLGYFALLRYDQLDELGAKLRATGRGKKNLEAALGHMGEKLKASDWHHWARDDELHDERVDPFQAFLKQRDEERRDYRVVRIVWVGREGIEPPDDDFELESRTDNATYLRLRSSPARPPNCIEIEGDEVFADGVLRYFLADK